MPLPRFRLRTLMIAVAVVAVMLAVGFGLQRRSARFEQLSRDHLALRGPSSFRSFEGGGRSFHTAKGRWHYNLSVKYREAARRPWLPVPPDPPPPE